MSARSPLICALTLALLAGCTHLREPTKELSYQGSIFKGQQQLPVTTVFWRNPAGDTQGRYSVIGADQRVLRGTLGPCENRSAREGHGLRCEWKDNTGKGYFHAVFSPNRQSFRGRWGPGDLRHSAGVAGTWSGKLAP